MLVIPSVWLIRPASTPPSAVGIAALKDSHLQGGTQLRRLTVVLCAFALIMAVGVSQASAEEHAYGADGCEKAAAPAGMRWGFSGVNRVVPTGSALRRRVSSDASTSLGRTLAYGGGTNISAQVELPSGVPSGTVNASTHPHDVYVFYLEAGAGIQFYLSPSTPSSQIQLRLFSPDAEDINVQSPIAVDSEYVYPTADGYRAPVGGYYYVDVYAVSGASEYTLDYELYASPNDDVVGVPISASPVSDWLDANWDIDDVYRVPLRAGDRLSLSLSGIAEYASDAFDLDLYLLGPASTSVWPHDTTNSVAHSWNVAPAGDSIVYTAPTAGNYYVDVAAYEGWGPSYLSWSVSPIRPKITRSPSASKLTYKRKKGKVTFKLKAKMLNQFALPVAKRTKVYLQTSSNGRSWKNTYTMYTDSTGSLTKTITAKKKGTKYYRWYRPKSTTNTSAQTGAQKVVIK
jgi:hypothetical protein